MTASRWLVVCSVLAGCARGAPGGTEVKAAADPQPPEPARFEEPGRVRWHMRAHFGDLRDIERLLIVGKLDEAKTRAFLLTMPPTDPQMARWQHEVDDVTEAARALVAAPSVDEALRREVKVAGACAWCHARAQNAPQFPPLKAAPADDGKTTGRMARHQWAVDRLWEGMIGSSDHRWRLGLQVLADSPVPFSPRTDAQAIALRLQALAKREIANEMSETLEERTRAYGEMLVTCAACHTGGN